MQNRFKVLGVSLLVLSACADNGASNVTADTGNVVTEAPGPMMDTAAPDAGMADASMANAADAYVMNASLGDMYEIESSRLALEKSPSAEVKTFAQQMVTDHSATSAKLKATIAEARLELMPQTQLDARRQGMVDNLKDLSAAAFDTAYLEQQTAAHQEALALHTGFAVDGDNEPLKKLAAETAPRIQHHYEMVQKLNGSAADNAR